VPILHSNLTLAQLFSFDLGSDRLINLGGNQDTF